VTRPQFGLFAFGTSAHAYLEYDVVPGAAPSALVRAVAGFSINQASTTGANIVVGFRPELWSDARPHEAPRGAAGFVDPIVGPDGYTLPATQHDVLIWIAADAPDHVFDETAAATAALAEVATLVDETHGWSYHHHRDLTGFVDGTENPTPASAPAMVLVPDDAPGAGGAVLLVQKWEHDFSAWTALSDAEQEQVMGRTKPDSIELDDKPVTSHVARTDQDEFGHIFRRNTAYGTLQQHGTMFVGFAASRQPLDVMLRSMVGQVVNGGEPGQHGERDALTRYTVAKSGGYYFMPSIDALGSCA
jgi:putative iron-dependent peroxidase